MDSIDLRPFMTEVLESVSGELFKTTICMARVHLDDSGDFVDMPVHIGNESLSTPLLGMDVLRKGDMTLTHIKDDDQLWLRFTFDFLEDTERELL